MAAPISALGHLGIRRESSFASGGSVDSWQPIDSEDVQLVRDSAYGDRIQATEEQIGGIEIRRRVTGTITFAVSPSNPTEWWRCGLGQSTSPYSSERNLSSLLLQIDRETGAVQASGCMIGSLAFSSSQGAGTDAELKCAAAIEGKDMGACTAGTPSFNTSDAPYVHSEATFKLNGVTDADVTAFTVNIDNALADDIYGSDKTRQEIPATKITCTGSFTKLFQSTTERDAFLTADTTRSFQVTFTRGNRSFDINVAKLRYDSRSAPLGGQSEYIMETFNWTAFIDDVDSENSVVLTVDTSG